MAQLDLRQALMPSFVLGLWSWSNTVFRPAQKLKQVGLYRPPTLGARPSPTITAGRGPDLSLTHREPLFLERPPRNYESVEEFDELSPMYESVIQPFTGPIVDETLAFMRAYVPRDARVLDPSCGPGRNAMRLARELVPDGEVVAADLSRGMVQAAYASARSRRIDHMAFFQADAAEPPPAFESYFDAVFCCMSFHHYGDAPAIARAFRRVLGSGGTCFIADAGSEWFIRLVEPLTALTDPGFARHRSGREFCELLAEAGFSRVFWTEVLPGIGVTLGVA